MPATKTKQKARKLRNNSTSDGGTSSTGVEYKNKQEYSEDKNQESLLDSNHMIKNKKKRSKPFADNEDDTYFEQANDRIKQWQEQLKSGNLTR